MSRRALKIVLTVIGVVAVVAGTATVVLGAASVVGAGEASPALESELRFYAAWYVVAGLLLLSATRRLEAERRTILAVAFGFFLAACGRLLSWIVIGRPHALAITLMFVEFAIALGVPPWHAGIVRGAERSETGRG